MLDERRGGVAERLYQQTRWGARSLGIPLCEPGISLYKPRACERCKQPHLLMIIIKPESLIPAPRGERHKAWG